MTPTVTLEQAPPALKVSSVQVPKVALGLLTGGVAVGVATCFTNPIDVVKIRMQISATEGRVMGMGASGVDIVRSEGVLALWKGLPPALARGFLYGGIRLGLYGPIQDALCKEGETTSVTGKVVAGTASGSLAAMLTNPTDLVRPPLDSQRNISLLSLS